MDWRELSVLRRTWKFVRPWSVIFLHLFTSQQTHIPKAIYLVKSKLTDRKELSLLRLSPIVLRHWSLIPEHLLASQQAYFPKVTDQPKLRLMNCKELSVLRPSTRLLRPWPVISWQLLASQQLRGRKSQTIQGEDEWTVGNWIFWDIRRGLSDLDLSV